MKILGFLSAGSVIHRSGREYLFQLDGLGRKMPVTFTCLTIAGLGLTGVPLFAGFISKWNLTAAAVESGNVLAYVGVACLLLSALLTAIYMLGVVSRAFFPSHRETDLETASDPSWQMCLPLLVCAACTVILGVYAEPLIGFFREISRGLY